MTQYAREVSLESFEAVLRGGPRHVHWHVEKEGEWVPIDQVRGAETERDFPGPGRVWQRRTRVRLDVGTRLMRVESRPDRPPARDPLDYLWERHSRAARKVVRQFYRVVASGELSRERA